MKTSSEILRESNGNFTSLIKVPKPEKRKVEFISLSDRFDVKANHFLDISTIIYVGLRYQDKYIIPDYQRDLKWTKKQKQELIKSVLLGNPIGDFLIKEENPSKKERGENKTASKGKGKFRYNR